MMFRRPRMAQQVNRRPIPRFNLNAAAVRMIWVLLVILYYWYHTPIHALAAGVLETTLPIRLTVYCVAYLLLAGLALPGAVLLTPLAGPLFGVGGGTVIASLTSTAGATLAFLLSRHYLFRDHAVMVGPKSPLAAASHSESTSLGMRQLLLLRLIPVIPYFAVNILAGRSRLTIRQYWLASQLGMLPATFLLVRAGALCPTETRPSGVQLWSMLWPLTLLALLSSLAQLKTRLRRTGCPPQRFFARRSSNAISSLWLLATLCLTSGCALQKPHTSLDSIYSPLAKLPDHERNPVIVIPGVLGSRLVDEETGQTVWGKYDKIHFRRQQADNLSAFALPMAQGVPLSELRDKVHSDGTLAYLELKVFGVPMELQAYQQILQTLGVGGYRDPSRPGMDKETVAYGDDHFTCFQFDYDWRRDISENAVLLEQFIAAKREFIREEYAARYGIVDADIQFDIVAHSLGGLLTRYYLRYGGQSLPDDGSLPTLDWGGAANLDRVVLIGTPNAGSAFAIQYLVDGHQLSRFLPYYPPAALGTMPSAYQMLPRPRHRTLVDAEAPDEALDFYNPRLWEQMQWGLAAPNQDQVLQELLPDVPTFEARQCIALDHQRKCLLKAKQLHQAIDLLAGEPPGVTLHLYAGDAIETPAVMAVNTRNGELSIAAYAPGDDTTTRHSAVMSEQPVGTVSNRPSTPIHWSSVMFLHSSHRKLTADPLFTDNVLALLLQGPRDAKRAIPQ